MLALECYRTVVSNSPQNNKVQMLYHIVCWGLPLLSMIYLVSAQQLGEWGGSGERGGGGGYTFQAAVSGGGGRKGGGGGERGFGGRALRVYGCRVYTLTHKPQTYTHTTHTTGPTGLDGDYIWCWVKDEKVRLITFYAPLVVCWLACIVLYIRVMLHIRR